MAVINPPPPAREVVARMYIDGLLIAFFASAAFYAAGPIALLYHILWIERPAKAALDKVKPPMWTMFSGLLMGIMVSLVGLTIAQALEVSSIYSPPGEGPTPRMSVIFASFFLGLVEYQYVLYSWLRSSAIIKTQSTVRKVVSVVISVSPFILILPGVLNLLAYLLPGSFNRLIPNLGTLAAALVTLFLDVYFLYTFHDFQQHMTVIPRSVRSGATARAEVVRQTSLSAISWYGMVSSIGVLVCLLFYGISLVFSYPLNYTLVLLGFWAIEFSTLSLFRMKHVIHTISHPQGGTHIGTAAQNVTHTMPTMPNTGSGPIPSISGTSPAL